MPDGGAVTGPLAASAAGFLLPKIFGDDDRQSVSPMVQGMSQAEYQEAQRKAALNKQLQDIYQGRYDNAGANVEGMDLQKIFGGEYAGLAGEMLPGKFQNDALRGLMGMAGDVGGGTLNAEANRQYLQDESRTDAASGAVGTLVNQLLDLADRDMSGQQAPAAPTSYTPQSTLASTGSGVPTGLPTDF